jgi:hypothetical protein
MRIQMTPDRQLIVLVPDNKHRALRVYAVEHDTTVSEIVRRLIDLFLEGKIDLFPTEEPQR